MNILVVIYSLHGGGAEKTVRTLLERIDRRSFSLSVCLLGPADRSCAVSIPPDVPVYSAATRFRPASLSMIVKLCRIIWRTRPDQLLSFMWGGNIIALVAGMLTRTPVVISERIVTSVDLRMHSFSNLRRRIIALLYRHARRIIAVSAAVRQDLITTFGLPAASIEVIHNGIEPPRAVTHDETRPPVPQPYFLGCGRLVEQKNFAFLLDALAAARHARQVPVVLLGQGPLYQALKDRAAALSLTLVLPGFVPDPMPWMQHAAAFALTSRYEGFPNVVLEAMAAGTPVVALNTAGGISELVHHEQTGLLYEPDDHNGFAAALDRLLVDAPFRAALAAAAHEYVTTHFSVSHMVLQYQEVLSSAFHSPSR